MHNTAKFFQLHSYHSFGNMELDSNLLSSELSQESNPCTLDKQLLPNYKKCLQLCQSLREENLSLKSQIKTLTLQIATLTGDSPIKKISPLGHSNSMNPQNKIDMPGEVANEIMQYKKSLFEESKKKMREMRSAVDYVVKCYVEFTQSNSPKLKKILDGLKEDPSINKINKLWEQYRKQDSLQGSSLETNLYTMEKKQSQLLRKQLKNMKRITDLLVSDCRKEVEQLKAELKGNSQMIGQQLKKCMKKYLTGKQKEKQNKCSNKASTKQSSQQSIISRLPPNPHYPLNKTLNQTPKNCSTPKNNRSFRTSHSKQKILPSHKGFKKARPPLPLPKS